MRLRRVILSLILTIQEMPCKHTNRSYFMCLGVFCKQMVVLAAGEWSHWRCVGKKKGGAACDFEKHVGGGSYAWITNAGRHPPVLHGERKPPTSSRVGWNHTSPWRMANVEKTCTDHRSTSPGAGNSKSVLHGPDTHIRHLLYKMPPVLTHTHLHRVSHYQPHFNIDTSHTQTDGRTDANRFYYLSHAICYSYGADKDLRNRTQCNIPIVILEFIYNCYRLTYRKQEKLELWI